MSESSDQTCVKHSHGQTVTDSYCRRASHDTDVAASPALLSDSEASELFGDYIDEDSQTVQRVRPPSCTHVLRSLNTDSTLSSLK